MQLTLAWGDDGSTLGTDWREGGREEREVTYLDPQSLVHKMLKLKDTVSAHVSLPGHSTLSSLLVNCCGS